MRRADRLFRIVEYLKARRQVVRAEDLAHELEVSVRTIYRDITDLGISGVPIIGEAGVGYMLDRDHVVRPLMFDAQELDALMLGAQMVRSWPDAGLSQAASSAIDKIAAVLPDKLRADMEDNILFSLPSRAADIIKVDFAALRHAIRSKHIVSFLYTKESGETSKRIIRPLALAHFSPVWLLLGWDDACKDFRNFRLDRMGDLRVSDKTFKDERGKSLKDFKRLEVRRKI